MSQFATRPTTGSVIQRPETSAKHRVLKSWFWIVPHVDWLFVALAKQYARWSWSWINPHAAWSSAHAATDTQIMTAVKTDMDTALIIILSSAPWMGCNPRCMSRILRVRIWMVNTPNHGGGTEAVRTNANRRPLHHPALGGKRAAK